jgi:hypothetical protein
MPTLAGNAVYLFCDGRITYNGRTRWAIDQRRAKGERVEYPRWLAGNCSVVLPGRDPLVLARNQMLPTDGLTYGPEIDGDRMYFRLRSGVLCIRADEAGRAWQAREVAETLLSQLPTADLGSKQPLKPARKLSKRVLADDPYRTRRGTMRFINGQVRTGWYAVGPVPQAEAGEVGDKIVDGKRNWLTAGKGLPKTFGDYPLTDISRDQNFKKGWNIALTPEDCIARQGIAYSIPMAHGAKPDTALYWVGAIAMRGQKTLRWDCPNDAVTCWIGGTGVKHGQRITLGRGTWQLVLRTDLKEGAEPPLFRPRLWDATDIAAEKAFIKNRLVRMKPYFDEAKVLAKDEQLMARIEAVERLGE